MRRRGDYDLLGSLEDEDNDGGKSVPFARSYVFSSKERVRGGPCGEDSGTLRRMMTWLETDPPTL